MWENISWEIKEKDCNLSTFRDTNLVNCNDFVFTRVSSVALTV